MGQAPDFSRVGPWSFDRHNDRADRTAGARSRPSETGDSVRQLRGTVEQPEHKDQ